MAIGLFDYIGYLWWWLRGGFRDIDLVNASISTQYGKNWDRAQGSYSYLVKSEFCANTPSWLALRYKWFKGSAYLIITVTSLSAQYDYRRRQARTDKIK